MVQIFTVWASAGCGKTEFLTRLAQTLIEDRICAKDEILFSTFAKEAANTAADRAGVTGDERRQLWFRTLHSACYRLLRVRRGQVVTPSKMREFGKTIGVEINEDFGVEEDEAADIARVILAIERIKTSDNPGNSISKVIAMYQHARLTAGSRDELEAARHQPSSSALQFFGHLDWSRYPAVIDKYEEWKRDGELLDFVDMLERVVLGHVDLPRWKAVLIDECQDLSPLQWKLVDKFSDGAEWAFYVGDDFQAIHSFQGSSASHFLSYRSKGMKVHLPTTRRFGQRIIDLGKRIVAGLPESEPKEMRPFKPVDNPVQRIWDVSETEARPGSQFWLHRHREGCNALANWCIMNSVPFWAERGVNPLGKGNEVAGFIAASKLIRGEVLDGADVLSLTKVIRSSREIHGERVKFLKHGSMTKLENIDPGATMTPMELSTHFTEFFWDALRARDWSVTDIRFGSYYQALEEAGWKLGGTKEPDITITTIHGSKGRDAENVFVWDEILPKCLRDLPSELRVAYVAVTRTKGPLYIVSSPVTSWNMTSFPYPIEGLE